MIKRATFQNLRGYADPELRLVLNTDLNLITGKNGAGKTTLLKVLWYLISGNIHVAAEETPFSIGTIETEHYSMTVDLTDKGSPKVVVDLDDETFEYRSRTREELDNLDLVDLDDEGTLEEAGSFTEDFGSSLFFPTFRRVEGGYTIPREASQLPRPISRTARPRNFLEEGLREISHNLSNMGHHFVCSVSTNDIVSLVLDTYNTATQQYSLRHNFDPTAPAVHASQPGLVVSR